jgi:hypothetical protein
MFDQSKLDKFQKLGANARARGESEWLCPCFKPSEMPKATGESIEDWNAKVEAWRLGWKMEDAMRS